MENASPLKKEFTQPLKGIHVTLEKEITPLFKVKTLSASKKGKL
jgi:hypothetical protein